MGLSRVRLRRAMERYAVEDALDLNCWRGRGASLLAGAASRCKTAPRASYCCAAVTAARKPDWRNIDRRSRAARRTETRASPGADVGESRRRCGRVPAQIHSAVALARSLARASVSAWPQQRKRPLRLRVKGLPALWATCGRADGRGTRVLTVGGRKGY